MAKVGEATVEIKLDDETMRQLMDLFEQATEAKAEQDRLFKASASSSGTGRALNSASLTPPASVAAASARPSTYKTGTASLSGTAGSASSSITDDIWWGYIKTHRMATAKYHLFKRKATLCGLRKNFWPSKHSPHPVRQCKKCQAKFLALVGEEYVDEG
jgi:hypothetical protein